MSGSEAVEIKVSCRDSYSVHVAYGIISDLPRTLELEKWSKCLVVVDEGIKDLWGKQLAAIFGPDSLFFMPAGEANKTIRSVETLWQKFFDFGLDRKSLVINIGGGVLTDMAGFAASTFMRGVSFVQVPTTLLAQVDASIGGKTGINFSSTKNSIGVFQQPRKVIVDTQFLTTLDSRLVINGIAEMLKHGIIASRTHFQQVADFAWSETFGMAECEGLVRLVADSVAIKADVVQRDEKESGLRKILNLGHTIAHALEAEALKTKEPMLHGEAVGLGMVAEGYIANEMGILSGDDLDKLIEAVGSVGLYIKSPLALQIDSLMSAMRRDKKNIGNKLNFTLPTGIGSAVIDQFPEENLVLNSIRKVL